MVNPLYSFNYFPLVSGSGGQDSLNSFNSCSKKTHPHGKIRVHLCHLWEINYPWERRLIIRVIINPCYHPPLQTHSTPLPIAA